MATFAQTPRPPYHAVIFTSRATHDSDGYERTAARMLELAADRPGFLGVESAGDARDGLSITVSYWTSEEAIQGWRLDAEHILARETGRARWYDGYEVRVARIDRAYGWISTG